MAMSEAGNWVRVASAGDIGEGEAYGVQAAGRSIAVYHVEDGDWYATDNICTHAFALLTEGWLEGCIIECPLHGGRFDVRNGQGQGAPIETDLKTYPIRVEGDDVLVQVTP